MGRIGLVSGTYTLLTADETIAFGEMAACLLQDKTILALSGDLGAGKTTFVQGLAKGLGISEPVQSPTFVILNVYDRLAHFDLYRLKKSSDFIGLGFEEYFDREGICVIEWPDRIADILPKGTVYIDFIHQNEGRIAKVRA